MGRRSHPPSGFGPRKIRTDGLRETPRLKEPTRPATTYSPNTELGVSTIGPGRLNCRVRNGNGCFPAGNITGLVGSSNDIPLQRTNQASISSIEEYGQASRTISTASLNLTVIHSRPINPVVFRGPLGALRPGKPYLEAGFAIRCFHRLSLPHTATQRCPWQDSWYTGGASSQVLSYCGQLLSSFLRAW